VNKEDDNSFHAIMIGLGEVHGKVVTSKLLTYYHNVLREYTFNEIDKAAMKIAKHPQLGRFFPKPSDFVDIIEGDKRSFEDKALITWMEIEHAIKSNGAYRNLELDDKLGLAAVSNMGTWESLCHTPLNQLQWKKKEFIENYKALDGTPTEMLPMELKGIADYANSRKSDTRSMGAIMDKLELKK